MSDEDPFASFAANPPPEAETAKPKKERKKRTPKANGEAKPAQQLMVPVTALAAFADLTPDELKLASQIAAKLGELSKKRREAVATALAKLFA